MNPGPLVTILINNYNYGRFIGEAIESALSQTYKRIEIMVVDDGSTDESHEVIAKYSDRVHVIHKENGGQSSALNAGFSASKGEIICFLDSDDLFSPDKVRSVVEVFERHGHVGWCFHRLHMFGADTETRSLARRLPYKFGELDARRATAAGRPPFLPTATSGLSFRRELLARILPMSEKIHITSDNYVKFVALALTPGWMDSQELSLQRLHGENAYTNRPTNRNRSFGRITLLTGMSLYQRAPVLRRLGKHIFCKGLGLLWATGGIDPDSKPIVDSFLASFALPVRSILRLRAACNSALQLL